MNYDNNKSGEIDNRAKEILSEIVESYLNKGSPVSSKELSQKLNVHLSPSSIRLVMSKLEERNAEGGETAMLHLDDWEHCDELFNDPTGQENFLWGSPKSKNIDYKVEHPIFSTDQNGRAQISYIDQFPEPKNMKQGIFLQKLSDNLEESKNKIITKLPVGSSIVANNYFWLHGRRPFKENKDLSRELLRIRGSFFIN